MITYTIRVIDGGIDKLFIKLQCGTTIMLLQSAPLRCFIQKANKVGIYQILEEAPKHQRELLAFIYETYSKHFVKDDPVDS